MNYMFEPGLIHIAGAAAATVPVGYALAWLLDKLILKWAVEDRLAGIALGCAIAFVLMMAGSTAFLTWYAGSNPFEYGPIVIPPIGYAISFIVGLAAVGAIRTILYGHAYQEGDEEMVFDPDIHDHTQYDEEVVAWDEKHRHKNYLRRHWAGHLSLPISYWVNGALLSALILAAVEYLIARLAHEGGSLKGIAIVALVYLAFSALLWVWSSVGTWRSAYWHRRRGGTPGWGFAARTMIVISLAVTLVRSGDLALAAAELGTLARGRDSLGEIAAVTPVQDGRVLLVKGNLAAGTAARFEEVLSDNPRVREVLLSSHGGRMLEAERIAGLIRSRGFDTRVEDHCMSACTTLLLAGRVRTAPEAARIGFHQPSFPGLSAYALQDAVEKTRADYLAAGVDQGFVWRALATPAESMWFPPPDLLVEAKVLTGSAVMVATADGGSRRETLAEMRLRRDMSTQAAEINASGPTRLGPMTILQRATASGTRLTYHYRLETEDVFSSEGRRQLARNLRSDACSSVHMALAIREGGTFVHSYSNSRGRQVAEVTINKCP